MRQRGAALTDIAVLVVAADDGVKPQTIEALSHAKAAGCPVVVALTKCDKEQSDPKKARKELLTIGLELEEVGGDVQVKKRRVLNTVNALTIYLTAVVFNYEIRLLRWRRGRGKV